MKAFLIKSFIFSLLPISVFSIIFFKADGNTDPFYIRVTTAKQENIILGTSRAAQGIQPRVIDSVLAVKFNNYAFTVWHSPYGKVYYESVLKKLKQETENGIFILTVDPWSISSQTKNPNDSINFRENNSFLDKIPFVNISPNPFYLIHEFKGKYSKIISNNNDSSVFLHKNGWLEVTIDMDSSVVNKRIDSKIKNYRINNLPKYKYSNFRYEYLKRTIRLLRNYGKVYLVRLPIHPAMMEIENELMPEFDKKINRLVPFTEGHLDMTPNNSLYQYTDGNHLYKNSGVQVTREIALWIKKIKRTHNNK